MYPCTQCKTEVKGRYYVRIGTELYKLCEECTKTNFEKILEWHKEGTARLENHLAIRYFSRYIDFNPEQELNDLIGMNSVKKEVAKWMKQLQGRKKLAKDKRIQVSEPMMHMFITGSSGVGKTVLARKLADLFYLAGILPTSKLVEVSLGDITGEHVGHTVPKVEKKVKEAMGGVFFLDEAYRLAGDGLSGNKANYGLEALETLMQAMENHKGDIIFIFAGYEDKMEDLFEMNEGLRSRIAHHFKLEDYTPEELVLIGEMMLTKKGYNIESVKSLLSECIKEKADNGVLKGNGGTVRTMMEKVIMEHSIRIGEEHSEDITVIEQSDVKKSLKPSYTNDEREGLDQLFRDSLDELDEMIGLTQVKNQLRRIGNFQYIQNKRREKGLPIQKAANHMFFMGEPGTGKTTVARIAGKILRGVGVLSNGHLVEISKDDLTGSRIPTTKQVKKIIQKAKGGILFLDEAYTLANDMQGKEALDALIKEMEENREDLVIILAGYEQSMKKLLQQNEGLASRIPHHILFPNYLPSELLHMLNGHFKRQSYVLTNDARYAVEEKIKELYQEGMLEGNGRWIRNVFERILMAQSQRLMEENRDDYEFIQEIDVLDAFCELEYQTPQFS